MCKTLVRTLICLTLLTGFSTLGTAQTPPKTIFPAAKKIYEQLPLTFEKNLGQTDSRVQFLSRGSRYALFLSGPEAVLRLNGGDGFAVLRSQLVGANMSHVAGMEQQPGVANYLKGADAQKWVTGVPTFTRVKYADVYPGIDLVYYGSARQLEYDFVVSPGADARKIAFKISGAKKLRVGSNGDLKLALGKSEVTWKRPVAYQERDGVRKTIHAIYKVRGNQVGFALGAQW